MACICARVAVLSVGWECSINGNECMFPCPDSKLCAEKYNEGPEANNKRTEKDDVN